MGSYALAGGGGCEAGSAQTEDSGTAVVLEKCSFGPVILRAPDGATVTWKNADYLPHAVAGVGWGQLNGTIMAPGASFTQRFSAPGLYPYTCYLHPGMSGLVIVGDVAATTTPQTPPAPAAAAAVSSGVSLELAAVLALGSAVVGSAIALGWRARMWRFAKPVQA